MTPEEKVHSERVLTALLLAGIVIAGVALMREGPHFDNTLGGTNFFTSAFAGCALLGFVLWTHFAGITPAFTFSGPSRLLWLATFAAALGGATLAGWANRTFATPTERTIVAPIEAVEPGKGDRWHVTLKNANGQYERYLVSEENAKRLNTAKTVRMRIARGALGFDYIAEFEPQ
jgi:hypothetical protein